MIGFNWVKDKSFQAIPGQAISAEVYEEMLNVLPPKTLPIAKAEQAWDEHHIPVHAGFLMGEPHCCDSEGPLYLAFGMNDYGKGKKYFYLGLSRPTPTLNGQYYFFDCLTAFENDGLCPVSKFKNDKDAIQTATNYEASLYKYVYKDSVRISKELLYEPRFF